MHQRLSSKGFSSFLAFYSCSRIQGAQSSRSFSLHRPQCLHNKVSRIPAHGVGQKRAIHASAPLRAQKDPYQVLGVERDATPAQIKKVYFQLARKYHPDTSTDKGAQDKFVEIQSAYDILKDEKKRQMYDQYGATSQEQGFDPNAFSGFGGGGGGGGFPGFHGFGGNSPFGKDSDLFSQLFQGMSGGRSGFSQAVRGGDLEVSIRITFLEACKGTSRKVNTTPVVDCPPCSGSGLKPGAKRSACPTCKGTGTRTFVIDSGFQMASTCNTCSGSGSTVPRTGECTHCGGVGKVRTKTTVQVDIIPGVEDGMTLRVPKQGDAPISGKGSAGDLLVRINVTPSKDFSRQGNNLYHKTRIPMHVALLGGKVRVPTLDGDVDVRVPSGTQQDEEMVLKGRGVPSAHGGDGGDLFVAFSVQLPRSLTNRQRELLEMYADDIEGRRSSTSDETSTADDKGTLSFTRPSSASNEGWMNRAWQHLRRFTGI
ncbi:DnaJ protein [Mycena polygramma]|nr:DnaJ protein [Mycena polygramma]